jgi:hypothetical protein
VQFTATLVEYLVIGTVALFWLVPLSSHLFGVTLKLDEANVILILPLLYVLGMYIDATASILLHKMKWHVKDAKEENKKNPQPYKKTVKILLAHSPEIAQTMQALVTRDRIARGSFLNALLVIPITCLVEVELEQRIKFIIIAALASLFTFTMWQRFDKLTSEFKKLALEEIQHLSPTSVEIEKEISQKIDQQIN